MAYSPTRRECRLSGYDQRDSRILYDPLFDYYENLVGNSIGKDIFLVDQLFDYYENLVGNNIGKGSYSRPTVRFNYYKSKNFADAVTAN